jgi:hypothetical protein
LIPAKNHEIKLMKMMCADAKMGKHPTWMQTHKKTKKGQDKAQLQ